jgi:hypothetical protein
MAQDQEHYDHLPQTAPEELHWFLEYWQSKRPEDGGNPPRRSIDPADFPKLLNTIFIVQRTDDGRHKVRLAGTFYHYLYGREITGAYIEELAALNTAGRTLDHAQQVCARTNRPVYTEATMRNPAFDADLFYKRLLLPLAGDDADLEFMIGSAVFFDGDGERVETGHKL